MAPLEIRCDVGKLADVIRAANAKMIAIDGCDGAGKTFLAEQLGIPTNLHILRCEDEAIQSPKTGR